MKLKEKLDRRASILTEVRALVDKVDAEKRDMNAEEQQQYDKALVDIEKLSSDIDREQRLLELEAKVSKVEDIEDIVKPNANSEPKDNKEMRVKAFSKFLKGGINALSEPEKRALNATTDEEGAYTIPPEQFVAQLLKDVDDLVFIRQAATKFTLTTAASLGIPSLDADPADADWTTELLTGNEDGTMAFGKREFATNPFAKRIKISKSLIGKSALPIEDIVRQRMAYKFGITEEKAYLTGNGTGKPLGIFVASADGIPSSRDISDGNTATAITFDGLINARYALKQQYLARAAWLFHRDAIKMIAKLKDSENRYIWQPSVQVGQPDILLGRSFYMSEYAPNTFTAGQYVGIIGDFSFYWVVDALDMQFQRLVELYAETNQIGYIARKEGDGMPVMGNAFARVKLAASS
jgi:HK97 family phage major capsid protein